MDKGIFLSLCRKTSGAGSAHILQQLCTSGYKYDTFSICSSNLPGYKINASHRDFFHFQDGYHDFQDGRQNNHNSSNKSKSLTKACVFWIKMSPDTFLMYHTERRLHSSLSYSSVEKQTGSKIADKTLKFGILMYV